MKNHHPNCHHKDELSEGSHNRQTRCRCFCTCPEMTKTPTNTSTSKCEVSPQYGKDEFKNLHFYCDKCGEEMDYNEDRICGTTPTTDSKNSSEKDCKYCGVFPFKGHDCPNTTDTGWEERLGLEWEKITRDESTLRSFIQHIAKEEYGRGVAKEKKLWMEGLRCENCGGNKNPDPLSDLCGTCWEEA